uniref:15-hydroxyprostaglandin dehydrogenase [NAD(+)] n=1 Tax=Salarias fasciatus TaxID=181472 RepID=A0A672GJP3_SALFA
VMLKGKVAVVTGAAMGIGQATTKLFLQNGAKVALLDLNERAGKSVKKALDEEYGPEKTVFLQCNVESDKDVKDAFQTAVKTFKGIDIVCNNAGILNEPEWEKSVSINLTGVIRVGFVALEHMNKLTGGRGGVIVNTASLAGLAPRPVFPAYAATKHGVVGFTRSMAAASDALGYGIRFNALCPAGVQTNLFDAIKAQMGQFSDLYYLVEQSVQKGILDVSQVAEGALELATDETKNGEALILRYNEKKYAIFPTL